MATTWKIDGEVYVVCDEFVKDPQGEILMRFDKNEGGMHTFLLSPFGSLIHSWPKGAIMSPWAIAALTHSWYRTERVED